MHRASALGLFAFTALSSLLSTGCPIPVDPVPVQPQPPSSSSSGYVNSSSSSGGYVSSSSSSGGNTQQGTSTTSAQIAAACRANEGIRFTASTEDELRQTLVGSWAMCPDSNLAPVIADARFAKGFTVSADGRFNFLDEQITAPAQKGMLLTSNAQLQGRAMDVDFRALDGKVTATWAAWSENKQRLVLGVPVGSPNYGSWEVHFVRVTP